MKPCNVELLHEVEQLRAEIGDIKRCDAPATKLRAGQRVRVAAGFVAGALGAAALLISASTLDAQANVIAGCVMSDNFLKITTACGPGEFKVSLVTSDISKDGKASPTSKPLASTRVVAPFEVVDERGVPIMRVASAAADGVRGLRVFNGAGDQVAVVNVVDNGGLVKVFKDGQGDQAVAIAVTNAGPEFILRDGPNQMIRASISTEKGALGLRFFNASGKPMSGIGHTANGIGQVGVRDSNGVQRAFLDGTEGAVGVRNAQETVVAAIGVVDNSHGIVHVFNGKTLIGALTQGSGGGLLQLMNSAGRPMVEAKIDGGVGTVITVPGSKLTLPGQPSTFIAGRK
jgi:hypothetical protein